MQRLGFAVSLSALVASACGSEERVSDEPRALNADPSATPIVATAGAPTTSSEGPAPVTVSSPGASQSESGLPPTMSAATTPPGVGTEAPISSPDPTLMPAVGGSAPSATAAGGSGGGSGGLSAGTAGSPAAGASPLGGAGGANGGAPIAGGGGMPDDSGAAFPFPIDAPGDRCITPSSYDPAIVRQAYDDWKATVVTSDGAGGYLRVWKPDSGNVIGSTVSEGIGYGMLLAVYMNDQEVFDNLWRYEQLHLNSRGLMDWEIDPSGNVIGTGAASDGDEDMAFALVMADRQWGGQGTLDDTYLNHAIELIDLMWEHEVDHGRNDMLKAGDEWGDVDITNPSYFAPAYFRVFGQVTGNEAEWNRVVESSYDIIEASLNAASGNQDNGLVPAWCNSQGVPTEAYAGAPVHFQQDSTRTPFRVGQDYCYFGEPRAKAYLEKITSFYQGVGVSNIVDGYDLDGTPRPERATGGLQSASFVGPAGVGAMNDPMNQVFVDEAYAAVATLGLSAGTIYYQKSWTALSLLMLTGNFVDLTAL